LFSRVDVSSGNDVDNIEIVSQILAVDKNVKIHVQIENRNLRYFHKDNGLLEGKNIKIFSYYEDASRELFKKYDIDGENDKIISSNEDYYDDVSITLKEHGHDGVFYKHWEQINMFTCFESSQIKRIDEF
jgi:hypothetical protein